MKLTTAARATRRALVLLPLLGAAACLTGCGGDAAPTRTSFPPLRYDYLTPIRLNVASIEVQDEAAGPPGAGATLPVSPAQALRSMAEDRLLAAGAQGRAVFVIDQAVLTPVGRGLAGTLAVHLDVLSPEGGRAGFAEAQVSRRVSSVGSDPRGAAYDLLRQMMDDMNVEFEFQVRRSLRDSLQTTAPNAPPPAPVEQQDLSPPS